MSAMTDKEQLSLFDPPPASLPRKQDALPPDVELGEAIGAWLDVLQRKDTSRHTLQAFTLDLKLLAEYLDDSTALNSLTTAKLNEFLDWMKNKRGVPCSDKTYGRRVTSVKAFFRWATPAAGLRQNPAEAVLQLSVRSPLPVILSEEEVARCLAAGERLRHAEKPDSRPLLLLSLLLQTGMKKVEVANLKQDHLELGDSLSPYLYVRYPNKKDWAKERKLQLSPKWVDLYHEYLGEHAPKEVVFPWSVRKLEYALGDTGRAAGLDKSVSFDTMRWTCAVRDFLNGMDEDALRRKMGLSEIQWRETSSRIKQLAES